MFDHDPYQISPFADQQVKHGWAAADRWMNKCMEARAKVAGLEKRIEELEK